MSARSRRVTAAAAGTLLLAGLFTGVSPGSPASAHPEDCATKDADGNYDLDRDICFTEAELAAMDDSGAELAAGETASSRNFKLLANLPKAEPFAAESAFNSDMAFKGKYAFTGNYNGFSVIDISEPESPQPVTTVECLGSQNDISTYKDLLILGVDSSRSNDTCNNVPQSATNKDSWEGIRIFDISDPADPQFVTSVETDCGSHTQTTIPDPENDRAVVYVSSYRPSTTFPDCQPPHDKISVVAIPDAAPADASVVNEPVLFPGGGFPGILGQTSETSGCHDITAYPAKGIAAGACMGEGVLIDISDPVNPVVTDSVTDPNFAFWHSATFNNAADTVVFTDELGGGGSPTCNPTVGPEKGANGIYEIVDGKLQFASYYKIPRVNKNTENCVAHNGSLIPVQGRDVMVQAWYQGGTSVFDFTDPANPREIAWFDRGPISEERTVLGGSWSSYFYNGKIYSSDIQKGLDVFQLSDPALAGAGRNKVDHLNVQTQQPYNG